MMTNYIFRITENHPDKPFCEYEWAAISAQNFQKKDWIYHLDSQLEERARADFQRVMKNLHGHDVCRDDDAFSLYPRDMRKECEKAHAMMRQIIDVFDEDAKTLYDTVNCEVSLCESIVLTRYREQIYYVFYQNKIMNLRQFLNGVIDTLKVAGLSSATYYMTDVRGCRA